MATIKNPALQIEPGSNGKKKVTVKFKLAFSKAEAGNTYRYDIKLRGEDKPGDEQVTIGGQLLEDFNFKSPVLVLPTKKITAQAGEQVFTETRQIAVEKLNEDPGFNVIHIHVPPMPVKVPHKDEVYAEVVLMLGSPISLIVDKERSETVAGFF